MQEHTSALIDRLIQFVLGYVVPGGVVLFALSTGSETVRAWFAGAQSGPTLVGFAFVLLGALALGFVVTAIRFCLFEVVELPWVGCTLVEPPAKIDEASRAAHAHTYADLRRSFYDMYLAGANLAVAIPASAVLWKIVCPDPISWGLLLGVWSSAAVSSVALSVGACRAIERYDEKRLRLLGPVPAA